MPLTQGPGAEFASFGDRDLIMGLTSVEACLDLSEDDIEVSGFKGQKKICFLRLVFVTP